MTDVYDLAEITKMLQEITHILLTERGSAPILVYTVAEVAELLKCKESTVRNLIFRSKELRACLIGRELRIRAEDVQTFLAKRVSCSIFDRKVLP